MEKVKSFSIHPERITKPFQVLAAWLGTLVMVNGSFLYTATVIQSKWLPHVLVIAAVINVWVFLWTMYNMQTKYRPEMQGDEYYSNYLKLQKDKKRSSENNDVANEMMDMANLPTVARPAMKKVLDAQQEVIRLALRFGKCPIMYHLNNGRNDWVKFHEKFRETGIFQQDLAACEDAGLLTIPDGVVREARLTEKGKRVMTFVKSN